MDVIVLLSKSDSDIVSQGGMGICNMRATHFDDLLSVRMCLAGWAALLVGAEESAVIGAFYGLRLEGSTVFLGNL